MKQSLAWLWLIGSVLYAVSVWFSADVVNVGSQTSAPAVTESPKSEQIDEVRTEPIAPQPLPDAGSSSRSFSEKSSDKVEAPTETSTAAPAERLVVRSTAKIRNGPSSKSTLLGTAPAGVELEVAEREGRWVRFVDPATSHTGWIYEGLLNGIGAQLVTPAVQPSKVQARNAIRPANLAARRKPNQARSVTRPASGDVSKQAAGDRPFALGYAKTPSEEEFAPNKRRFGFFTRRRMVKNRSIGE